eukprot:tig00020567_g11510.t1
MSRLALPPEIPAKLAKNTLYDVLCVGDSFGVDWTVFEAGISDQAKEAQARALEDGMQFSPSSKDVLRKTELAERKRKLPRRGLEPEAAEAPPRSQDADRLRLLMGAVPRHIAKGEWRTIGLLAGPEEFYFNRMAEAAPHLLWLLVLSSDPAYTPERLAKGIMGVEARCIMRNSRAFITRHESSAVWGERPDTGVLTDAYAIRIFEVPGVTIGDRVQVIRRCSMPDSHGRPMIHGAVKYVVPRRTLALTFFVPVFDKAAAAAAAAASRPRPMLAAAESSDSDSDSEAEREAEAAAAARALDFTEEELERARSLPRAGQAMAAAFQAAIGEATASASGARAGGSMITAEGLARAMRVAQAQAQAKGKGKGKAAYIDLRFEEEEAGAPAARRDLGEEMEAAAPRRPEAALAAAADAKASRELEVAEEYAMELEREREREGEPDAELAATVEAGRGTPSSPSPPSTSSTPSRPPPPSTRPAAALEEFSDDEPGDAGPRPPLVSPRRPPAPVPPPAPPPPTVPPRPPHPLAAAGTPVATPASSLGHMPPPPPPAPRAGRLSRRAQQRRERERQLLRDQRAEAEADHDDGQASESDGEPPRATRLELARAELAAQPREAPEIDMSKYDDVTTYSKDNKSKKEAAIQDALRLFVKNNRIVRQRPYGPNSPPTFYVELPNLFVYDKVSANRHAGRGTMKEVIQLLAMTFHKTYESNPGSFEFTFSKEVLSGRTRTFVEESLQLEDVCPEMPVIPGFAFACDTHFVVRAPQDSTGSACVLVMTHEEARERYAGYMNTCYIQGRLPAGIEEATETCDWPTVYGMLHPFMPNVVKHLADNGYVTADEFGYAAAVLYAFNLVGPWNFCDKPVFDREPRAEIEPPSEGAMLQYCGIIKGQSGTGKSMVTQIMTECLPPGRVCVYRPSKGSAFSEHGGEEAICMVMAEGLDPKACSEEELKMRSGDAYSRNFKNVRGDDVRTKATRKVLVIVCNSFPQLENRMLEFFARVNELPALMVAAFTFAWKIIHALSDGKASCIQAFEPAWLRAQRLGFWQETARLHDERRGIVEYIARTEGPDTSAAVGADIENGRLDETLAGFGSWCRPYSYKLGGVWQTYIRGIVPKAPLSLGESQPALEAIAIPVASSRTRGRRRALPRQPHTKGKGKRTRNSAPAFLPPQPPATAPSSAPASSASTRCCRARVPRRTAARARAATGARPPPRAPTAPAPSPAPAPSSPRSRASGPSRRPSGGRWRRARRARRRSGARPLGQRLQATIAFRAELDSASARPDRRAEASERWRAFEAESAGLAKGLGYSYRRVPVLKDYASAAAREASRAEIDAAEEQAAREEAEDTRASGTCTTEAPRRYFFSTLPQFGPAMAFEAYPAHYSLGALAATLTWLLGGTPTASAVIGVGFGYAAKSLYAPAAPRRRRPACAPPGANFSKFILPSPFSEFRMSSAVEKLLCTVFKSDSRCSKIGEAARAKGGAAAEGPRVKAADPAPPSLKTIKGAGKGRSVGALPLVAIAPGQREAAHAATAALAARRQAEAYPCLGRGLHPPAGRPYAVSAYFDEANRLSCQELCDNRMRRAVDGHLPLLVALGGSLLMVWYLRGLGQPRLQFGEITRRWRHGDEERENVLGDEARGALGGALGSRHRPGKAGARCGRAERCWHWPSRPYPLEPGVKLERANAVSVKKAKRTLALEVPVAEDTEKVAFNKRKTYKAIREGQLLPTDSVPGLPGTTAGELLVRNLRLQYVSRLRRSKAKKARLDSGDSSSSS